MQLLPKEEMLCTSIFKNIDDRSIRNAITILFADIINESELNNQFIIDKTDDKPVH